MENKCKKCYENDKTPDENDCKKCQKVIIEDVDVSGCEYAEKSIPVDCSIANCFCYENKNCYYKQMKRLEQENNKLKTQYNCYACSSCKGKEDYINLEKHHKGLRTEFDRLHREIKRLKWYLNEIRYQELATLDIDWDEYETGRRDTEYTNIINLVQEALDEVPEEDCRYNREE